MKFTKEDLIDIKGLNNFSTISGIWFQDSYNENKSCIRIKCSSCGATKISNAKCEYCGQ